MALSIKCDFLALRTVSPDSCRFTLLPRQKGYRNSQIFRRSSIKQKEGAYPMPFITDLKKYSYQSMTLIILTTISNKKLIPLNWAIERHKSTYVCYVMFWFVCFFLPNKCYEDSWKRSNSRLSFLIQSLVFHYCNSISSISSSSFTPPSMLQPVSSLFCKKVT